MGAHRRYLGWLAANETLKPGKLSVETFITRYWPRAITAARLENDNVSMANDLNDLLELVRFEAWSPSEQARLWAPGGGLSLLEISFFTGRLVTLPVYYELHCLDSYFVDTLSLESGGSEEQPETSLRVASPEQSRELFEILAKRADFARLVGLFLLCGRWPRHLDPKSPDIRNWIVFSDTPEIAALCGCVNYRSIEDDKVDATKIWIKRFIAANGIADHKQAWLDVIKQVCEWFNFEPEAGNQRFLSVLKEALEEYGLEGVRRSERRGSREWKDDEIV